MRKPAFVRNKVFLLLIIETAFFWLLSSSAFANNVTIANVELSTQDSSANTILVEFDISWDNSWRNTINYDAVWVFVKYRLTSDTGAWAHATLKTSGTNPTGFSRGSGDTIDIVVPTDLYGCFIQRTESGYGSIDTDDIQLVWDYNADSLTDSTVIYEIQVFAIEMCYVPTGAFYFGDGDGAGSESAYAIHENGVDNTAMEVDTTAKDITCDSHDYDDIDTSPIELDGDGYIEETAGGTKNTDFPTGYNAFYIMKYELSQGQYRDFLNTLTKDQQTTRVEEIGTNSDYAMTDQNTMMRRDTIRLPASIPGSGPVTFGCDYGVGGNGNAGDGSYDQTDDGEWIALNYASWMDLCAYADWAGLRPITEPEYEKACRGVSSAKSAVVNEYAWGTTGLTDSATSGEGEPQNPGESNELPDSTGNGLCNYDSDISLDPDGPMRCGFAATSDTNRVRAGAGYYGVMEMSGNLKERCVTVGNQTGRTFEGTHGDGVLTTTSSYEGNATNTDWPGIDATASRGVTGATGSGIKMGSWPYNALNLYVSERNQAAYTDTSRAFDYGIRCGRTAP